MAAIAKLQGLNDGQEAHCPTVERQDIEGAAPPDATTEVAEVDGKAEHHRDREWWRKEGN
jgi:hypothetical protein